MVLTLRSLISAAIVASPGAFWIPLPGRAQAPPGACPLLSRGDVERVLRASAGDGQLRVNTEYLTSCSFTVAGGGSVSILLRRNASHEWIAEQKRRMSSGTSFQPRGGDSAFVLEMGLAGTVLCVFEGARYVVVSVNGLARGDSMLPTAEALARIVLTR